MNDDHVHVDQEYTLAEQAWDFLLNIILFAVFTLGMAWFASIIWGSFGFAPDLSWMNWWGILVLIRFAGFAFNYDRGFNE